MIKINQLAFSYPGSSFALDINELTVQEGERVAIIGPSGIGKTTLLHLIAGIYPPDAGDIYFADRKVNALSDAERRNLRITEIGFVFQDFKLIEYLSILDNILLPYRINRAMTLKKETRERTTEIAEELGIAKHLGKKPAALSQGERQRVAICRALLNEPKLILADEPTGNLDPENKTHIMETLVKYTADHNASLINVTHDHELLKHVDRTVDFQELLSR